MDEGNLIVSQRLDESVVIDLRGVGLGLVVVSVNELNGHKARISYRGRKSIPIHRKSVFDSIERERRAA